MSSSHRTSVTSSDVKKVNLKKSATKPKISSGTAAMGGRKASISGINTTSAKTDPPRKRAISMVPPKALKSAAKKVTAVSKISKSIPPKPKASTPSVDKKLSKSAQPKDNNDEQELEEEQVENEETILKTPTPKDEEEGEGKIVNEGLAAEGEEVTEQKEGEEIEEKGENQEEQPQPKKDTPIDYSQNIKVIVRCRPPNNKEKASGQNMCVFCDQDLQEVTVKNKATARSYKYDKVFGPYSTNADLFSNSAFEVVDDVLAGYNCTIFAYGQTGTGKTHTMEGIVDDPTNKGIIPRSVNMIFTVLKNRGADFSVHLSYMELYNEVLADLLNPGTEIKLLDDPQRGVVCQNLSDIEVKDEQQAMKIYKEAIKHRATAATDLNAQSSRSHSIFTLAIHSKEPTPDGELCIRTGKLNLVDLAGSECIGKSGAKDSRAREAKKINQSLLTLGRVITALVDGSPHVPYRDSKLTRLLQESLGGKAKTCLIATVTPSMMAMDETISTLEYAFRAKSIRNKPIVDQKVTMRAMILDYAKRIEEIFRLIQSQMNHTGILIEQSKYNEIKDALDNKTQTFLDLKSSIDQKRMEEDNCKGKLRWLIVELERINMHLNVHIENDREFRRVADRLRCSLYMAIEDQIDLRSKIDYGLQVEEKNAQNKDSYVKECQDKLKTLSNSISEYQIYHSQQSKAIKQNIVKFVAKHCQTLNETSSQVSSFIRLVCKDVKDYSDEIYTGIKKIESRISRGRKDLENWVNTINSTLEKQIIDIDESHKKFGVAIEKCDVEVIKITEDLLNKFIEKRKKFQELLDKERESILQSYSEFESKLLDDLQNYEKIQTESLNEIVQLRLKLSYANKEEVANFRLQYIAEVEKIHNEIDSYYALIEKCIEARKHQMTTHCTNGTNQHTEIQQQIDSMKGRTEIYLHEGKSFKSQGKQLLSKVDEIKSLLGKWDIFELYPKHCENFNSYNVEMFNRIKDTIDITESYLKDYNIVIESIEPVKDFDIPTQFTICDICSEERNYGVVEVSEDEENGDDDDGGSIESAGEE